MIILLLFYFSWYYRGKWTWAGQVSRTRDNGWTLHITTWKPYKGKRPRERPARHWRDELEGLLEGYHLAEDSAR